MTNNQINNNLIEIIELSLMIFDLWSHSHLWVVGWVDGHFDIFDIYLNHLSPLQGYFLFACAMTMFYKITNSYNVGFLVTYFWILNQCMRSGVVTHAPHLFYHVHVELSFIILKI